MGYSGIGYKTADVKTVPLKMDDKGEFVDATPEHAYDGKYPLSRFLFLTVNNDPKVALDPLRKEFLKYVFSKEGQEVVVKDGFYPLPFVVAKKNLAQIGVELQEAPAAK